MRLQVLQDNLQRYLNIASKFTSIKAQLPVLSNILLNAKGNKLTIQSTNLEISFSTSVGAKIDEEGEITIPSRIICDIVSNLNPGPIDIISEKESLEIKSSGFSSIVSGMNASDFPSVPSSVPGKALQLKKSDLFSAISKVIYSVSIDETRPVLTGVLFILSKGGISLVSTDGFRLSKVDLATPTVNENVKVIIPKTVLTEISRLSGDGSEISLFLSKDDSQILFGLDNMVFSSRLIEGDFPDFEKVIPKTYDFEVSADKGDIGQSIKLASVFARDSANMIIFSFNKGAMKITSESQYSGKQEKKFDVKIEEKEKGVLDDSYKIAFNYRFLEDFLASTGGEEILMRFKSSSEPGVFLDPSNKNFLHLIMPVKIQV